MSKRPVDLETRLHGFPILVLGTLNIIVHVQYRDLQYIHVEFVNR